MTTKTLKHAPFLFIRHGETNWNKEHRIMGSQDIPLNDTGIAQAIAVIEIIRHMRITHIVSSPLLRAKKTAEIIASALQIPTEIHADLKECNWGEAENTIVDESPVHLYLASGNPPTGGETITAFKQRVLSATNDILAQDGLPLIVGHGGIYWAIMETIGYTQQDAGNTIPCYFKPPMHDEKKWTVEIVGKHQV